LFYQRHQIFIIVFNPTVLCQQHSFDFTTVVISSVDLRELNIRVG